MKESTTSRPDGVDADGEPCELRRLDGVLQELHREHAPHGLTPKRERERPPALLGVALPSPPPGPGPWPLAPAKAFGRSSSSDPSRGAAGHGNGSPQTCAEKSAERRAASSVPGGACFRLHAASCSSLFRSFALSLFALRSSPPLAPPGGLAPAHAALALLLLSAKLPVGPGPEDPLQGRAEAEQKQKRRRGEEEERRTIPTCRAASCPDTRPEGERFAGPNGPNFLRLFSLFSLPQQVRSKLFST